jgi:hypothetical protein
MPKIKDHISRHTEQEHAAVKVTRPLMIFPQGRLDGHHSG